MKNNLGKKLIVGGMIVGASFGLDSCGKRYNIDGSKVHYNIKKDLVETYDGNHIKYTDASTFGDYMLLEVSINGRMYRDIDGMVFEKAKKRYNYLKEKMKEIDNTAAQKEIQKKKGKIKQDMKLIKDFGEGK
jgi:hypothetical protein